MKSIFDEKRFGERYKTKVGYTICIESVMVRTLTDRQAARDVAHRVNQATPDEVLVEVIRWNPGDQLPEKVEYESFMEE